MIDHIVLRVKDPGRRRKFYAGAPAPLGYTLLKGFPGSLLHIALANPSRKIVGAFHAAALEAVCHDPKG